MVWRMLSVLSRKKSLTAAVAQGEQAADAILGGVQAHLVPHPHADAAQMALPQQAAHGGGMRDPDVEGLVAARSRSGS